MRKIKWKFKLQKLNMFLCMLLCLLSVFSSSLTTNAANNPVKIKLMALGVTRTDRNQHNSTTFYDYEANMYWYAQCLAGGFVTAFYTIEGLPYGSFDVTIDYSVNSDTIKSFALQGDSISYSAGTSYDGEALKHGTKFYYDIGDGGLTIARSKVELVSSSTGSENRKITFHVNDYTSGTACIAISYFVNVPSSALNPETGTAAFGFKVNKLTYTTTEEHLQESLDNITNPDSADKNQTDEFQQNSSQQSGQIDNLVNDMGSMDKVDVNNAGNIATDGIDFDSISQYSSLLSVVTNNKIITTYMITLFAVGLCAYVLFGKKK